MSKSDYLHPLWQKFRLERLTLSDWSCEVCFTKDQTLHVHHRFYIPGRKPWQYPPQLTQVLCAECHQIAHDFSADYETLGPDFWEALLAVVFMQDKLFQMERARSGAADFIGRCTQAGRKEMFEAICNLVR